MQCFAIYTDILWECIIAFNTILCAFLLCVSTGCHLFIPLSVRCHCSSSASLSHHCCAMSPSLLAQLSLCLPACLPAASLVLLLACLHVCLLTPISRATACSVVPPRSAVVPSVLGASQQAIQHGRALHEGRVALAHAIPQVTEQEGCRERER